MKHFQNDCCRPWNKHPFKNVFKAVKNRKHSGYVDRQHDQIDCPKSVFLQTKETYFETMITTVNEVNRDKTKVGINFFSHCFACLFYFQNKRVN